MDGRHNHAVDIELLLLRADPTVETGLAYRMTRAPLRRGAHPDDVANGLVAAEASGASISVLHSTSWRYDASGGLVLTYAALPDPRPDYPACPLVAPSIVCSGDPLCPTPSLLHLHHVAAHAVHHLAGLARRDPGIAAATREDTEGEVWRAIAAAARSMPTGTHAAAHKLATVRPSRSSA